MLWPPEDMHDVSLGPLKSQIWAANVCTSAGITFSSKDGRAARDPTASRTASAVLGIADTAAMKEYLAAPESQVKWPGDAKLMGFVVVLGPYCAMYGAHGG